MKFDVIVIGAGAAGMMCAAHLGQAGKRVGLIDHSNRLGEKIRISGGGRCNFTNRVVEPQHFVSNNPRFASSILKGYTPGHFIELMRQHHLTFHEKHKGQLFCDQKSQAVIDLLVAECNSSRVKWLFPVKVQDIRSGEAGFVLNTSTGALRSKQLVIATGGLPVPKIGATDFGLHVAKQFGHSLIDTAPALVPLIFVESDWYQMGGLRGLSLPACTRGSQPGSPWFEEDILFTHRGLSGPGILQASSFWRPGQALRVNLSGYADSTLCMKGLQQGLLGSKAQLSTWLAGQFPLWPKRFVQTLLDQPEFVTMRSRKVAELGRKTLAPLVSHISNWELYPSSTAGYAKAEVMRGGVSTSDLNRESLESSHVPGLYFIGEVVDMTGWLGGYNFQWAWASAVAAAKAISQH